MISFESIKENVPVPDAARYYGLNVTHGGMCRCPFHDDKNPSMKLYEDHFHCFGCGKHGDVIDLVSELCGIPIIEAARLINRDYNLGLDTGQPNYSNTVKKPVRSPRREYRQYENFAFNTMTAYIGLLRKWKKEYAPTDEKEIINSRFTFALNNIGFAEYVYDTFLYSDENERKAMKSEINSIADKLAKCKRMDRNINDIIADMGRWADTVREQKTYRESLTNAR